MIYVEKDLRKEDDMRPSEADTGDGLLRDVWLRTWRVGGNYRNFPQMAGAEASRKKISPRKPWENFKTWNRRNGCCTRSRKVLALAGGFVVQPLGTGERRHPAASSSSRNRGKMRRSGIVCQSRVRRGFSKCVAAVSARRKSNKGKMRMCEMDVRGYELRGSWYYFSNSGLL